MANMKSFAAGLGLALAVGMCLSPALAEDMVTGEVTKVDESAGKITLRHGPIKKLDMDSMTMVFRAADPAMVKQVKPGDKVKFEPELVNGQLTIVKIEKAAKR